MLTVNNLLFYRGGCVFFMDYSNFASVSDYTKLVPHASALTAVLLLKVKQIANYDLQYHFGFCFGAQMLADAGISLNQSIARMDLCDPIGTSKLIINFLKDSHLNFC